MAQIAELATHAEELFSANKFEEALICFEKMQAAGCNMLPLRVHKAQCFFALEDFEGAIREVDKGLCDVEKEPDPKHQKHIYKSLAVAKVEMLKSRNAAADCRKVLEEIQRNQYSKKLREWAVQFAQSLDGSNLLELNEKLSENEEYKAFASCFDQVVKEGALWHIVSTTWVRLWLAHLEGQSPPGPISNSQILEKTNSKFLLDPDRSKSYTNVKVRLGLIEQEDFQVIPKAAYHFLVQKYSHDDTEIRRYSIATNLEGTNTVVEIWLKRVQVLVDLTVKEVQISRRETVADLKEKLHRITTDLRSGRVTRLWKKKTNESITHVVETLRRVMETKEPTIVTGATLLDDQKELENADIADQDILLIEALSPSKRWLLLPEHAETCSACGRTGNLLICNGCRSVKYCSLTCQRVHFPKHKSDCKRRQKKGRNGLVGLQNLGNTCFMNSALQCLSHTEALTVYLLEDRYKADLNVKNPIGTGGRLVSAYVNLVQNLWLENESVQSPWELKRTISTFSPQFSGYQQHDSHELLSYLLDGIHEDLNRVRKKPYTTVSEEPNRSDEEVATEFWTNHLKRNQSVIVDMMHGQYKSTLHCPVCDKISVTFDPFLTYTLQIPNKETKKFSFVFVPFNLMEKPKELHCLLSLTTTIAEVQGIISDQFHVSRDRLLTLALEHKRFKGAAGGEMELNDLKLYEVVIYETPEQYVQAACLSITEMTRIGNVRTATWPRLLFLGKDATAETIYQQCETIERSLLQVEPTHASIRIVNRGKVVTSYFMFQSRAPCAFCGEKECSNCVLPRDASLTIHTLYSKSDDRLELELRCDSLIPETQPEQHDHQSMASAVSTKRQISLQDCLSYSSRPEVLSPDNAWFCSKCKKEVQATKTLQMYKAPEVLIMHLKRFRPRYYEKLNTTVDFPVEGLNLSEFVLCSSVSEPIYDLYAVSNHYGSVLGGHYTAFVKNGSLWYDMDDSSVSEVRNPQAVVTPAAYMLFYRRRK